MKKYVKIIIVAITVLTFAGLVTLAAILSGNKDPQGRERTESVTVSNNASDDFTNILVMGTDRQAGLCDVMMLVNINFTRDTVTVAQIPRDTYAKYTDGSYKKLNGAYNTLGGAAQVRDFIAQSFGIRIDHYACIGLDTLARVVDSVGGVDVELPCDMKYSDVAQGLSIDLKKGTVHLDGRLAEQFVRFRSSYVEGDLGRIDAQKIFIAAMLEKISSEFSPLLAAKLVSCADGVETDLCAADMITLGTRVMSIDKGSIFLLTLPGQECVADVSGAWYYVLSGKATQRLMLEYFCASRDFDTQRVFLNENYDDFARIYNADMDYSMINVTRINEDGIDIHLKRK